MAKAATKKRSTRKHEEDGNVLKFPAKRTSKRARKEAAAPVPQDQMDPSPQQELRKPLVCKTPNQKRYKQCIESSPITFGLGPAGVGKTFIPTKMAAELLESREVERIIVTRPAVGVEEDYGALPGTLEEKVAPWFEPVLQALVSHFGRCNVEGMIKSKRIQFVPMGHLRGLTFEKAFVLLDEAQNTTPKQMKAFLTRLGKFSKIAITGDLNQTDIRGPNGLADAILKLKNKPSIAICALDKSDNQRHDIVRMILDVYEPDVGDDLNARAVNGS